MKNIYNLKVGNQVVSVGKFPNIPLRSFGVIKKIQNEKIWVEFDGRGIIFAGTLTCPYVKADNFRYAILQAQKHHRGTHDVT
ncbi:MAG: hypothetical protein Q8Q08_06590 [Candidatus Omnitrophota bacterium]|nr:hypothetical protein [Candidatus Omnitrophota bacterium]MDZ4243279.1 hypothetical protein [Candidatus Omnitrophota bacterium]